jgi:hypothetical protein
VAGGPVLRFARMRFPSRMSCLSILSGRVFARHYLFGHKRNERFSAPTPDWTLTKIEPSVDGLPGA